MAAKKKSNGVKCSLITIRFMIAVFMILILATMPSLKGELASQQEMDNVCRNWLTYKAYQNSAWAGSDNPQITQSFNLISGDMAVAKVYNISPDGFVIVPIIKELAPVKAYSETGRIDSDDNGGIAQLLKDVLKIKLETYERVFGELDAMPEGEGESGFWLGYHVRWDTFSQSTNEFESHLLNKNRAPLEQGGPLVTSMWHQHEPYKNIVPTVMAGAV